MDKLECLFFFSSLNFGRTTFIFLSIIFVLLLVENLDAFVVDFLVEFNTSTTGISLFVLISTAYISGQFFLFKLMSVHGNAIRSRSKLIASLHQAVTIVQYILACNVILLIFQMIVLSKYSTLSLIFVTMLSNIFTSIVLTIFSVRFIAWYRNKRQSLGVLLYALAFLILAVSEVIAGLGDSYLLTQKNEVITPASEVHFNDFHYSKKANKPKMILIIFLPLLTYTSSILDSLNLYDTDTSPNLFSYYIFVSLVRTSSGILFAISFWLVARRLPESTIKTFLKITAYGFILLYVSNHVGVGIAPYPPFGINSLSMLPLSSYFLLFGLYSSALSLSQDITLRNHLRSMARNDNNLLSSIGTAQMESEVKRAIGDLKDVADEQEKELAEKSGIETPVPESEIEDYLKQVIEEVARSRKK